MKLPKEIECLLQINVLLKRSLVIINVNRSSDYYTYLKPTQAKAIRSCVEHNKDLLGVLATGSGKTLIFLLIPVYNILYAQHQQQISTTSSITIVVSPLNSIICQQESMLGEDCCVVTSQGDELTKFTQIFNESQKLKAVQFKFIIGHPENLLQKNILDQMRVAPWNQMVNHVVVDEAHCVVTWSEHFRPKYRDIVELGGVFPNAKIIALTATATIKMRNEIIRLLGMRKPSIVSTTVDRSNIKYTVKRRPANSATGGVEHSYDTVFRPIIQESLEQSLFPKTIIYCGLKWCGFGHELALKMSSTANKELAQFHAPLLPQLKENIVKDFMKPAGDLKLLFATEAFGMGVNIPDVRRVVHAGTPNTLETYYQETGRAGRDGLPAEAIMYCNNDDIGKSTTSEDMKKYCRYQNMMLN